MPSSRKRCDSSSAGSREDEVGVVEVAYVRVVEKDARGKAGMDEWVRAMRAGAVEMF